MELIKHKNGTEAIVEGGINLPLTLDCGQAFRWSAANNGSFTAVVRKKEITVSPTENGILFHNTSEDEINEIWADYFDLRRDHTEILKRLTKDPYVKSAVERYGTIRILNQEPWETLCSFIISSCNNIPRIKGIIKKMSEGFGEKTGNGYAFPDPEVLAEKTEEELSFLKAGYRAPYILDAARRVASGETDLEKIRNMPEDEARKELMKIKGVGKKVADCTMLFSLGFTDVYPVDRHIERATKEYYPNGVPDFFSPDRGLAQQYIFSRMIERQF